MKTYQIKQAENGTTNGTRWQWVTYYDSNEEAVSVRYKDEEGEWIMDEFTAWPTDLEKLSDASYNAMLEEVWRTGSAEIEI